MIHDACFGLLFLFSIFNLNTLPLEFRGWAFMFVIINLGMLAATTIAMMTVISIMIVMTIISLMMMKDGTGKYDNDDGDDIFKITATVSKFNFQ